MLPASAIDSAKAKALFIALFSLLIKFGPGHISAGDSPKTMYLSKQ
jgi:hypothetical protein